MALVVFDVARDLRHRGAVRDHQKGQGGRRIGNLPGLAAGQRRQVEIVERPRSRSISKCGKDFAGKGLVTGGKIHLEGPVEINVATKSKLAGMIHIGDNNVIGRSGLEVAAVGIEVDDAGLGLQETRILECAVNISGIEASLLDESADVIKQEVGVAIIAVDVLIVLDAPNGTGQILHLAPGPVVVLDVEIAAAGPYHRSTVRERALKVLLDAPADVEEGAIQNGQSSIDITAVPIQRAAHSIGAGESAAVEGQVGDRSALETRGQSDIPSAHRQSRDAIVQQVQRPAGKLDRSRTGKGRGGAVGESS